MNLQTLYPDKYIIVYGYTPSWNDGEPCTYWLNFVAVGDKPVSEEYLECIDDHCFDEVAPEDWEVLRVHDLDELIIERSTNGGINYINPNGKILFFKEIW